MNSLGKDAGLKKKRIPKEFLGAFKEGHRPGTKELIDDEFAHELLILVNQGNCEARVILEYYTRFNNEYYKGVFTKTKDDLHRGDKKRKQIYREAWKRWDNRMVNYISENYSEGSVSSSPEDALIELIDLKNQMEKAKKQ